MINALWIPPANVVTVSRLIFWFLIGNIVFKEAWEDIRTWNTVERKYNPVEARFRWLGFGVITMEIAISFKFVREAGHLQLEDSPHWFILLFWVVIFSVCIYKYLKLRLNPNRTRKFIEEDQDISSTPRVARRSPRKSSASRRNGRSTTPKGSRRRRSSSKRRSRY